MAGVWTARCFVNGSRIEFDRLPVIFGESSPREFSLSKIARDATVRAAFGGVPNDAVPEVLFKIVVNGSSLSVKVNPVKQGSLRTPRTLKVNEDPVPDDVATELELDGPSLIEFRVAGERGFVRIILFLDAKSGGADRFNSDRPERLPLDFPDGLQLGWRAFWMFLIDWTGCTAAAVFRRREGSSPNEPPEVLSIVADYSDKTKRETLPVSTRVFWLVERTRESFLTKIPGRSAADRRSEEHRGPGSMWASLEPLVENGSRAGSSSYLLYAVPLILASGIPASARTPGAALEPVIGALFLRFDRESNFSLQRLAGIIEVLAKKVPPRGLEEEEESLEIVGDDEALMETIRQADLAAESDISVMILGETGTGKEGLAKRIHERSHRSAMPLRAVNCAAFTESLLESELFGHVVGAYTGAERTRMGVLKSADGGTVFLDEIGDMPLIMQIKLLRALQERKVRPVGKDEDVPINIRIVCATSRGLEYLLDSSTFRRDLYYRLQGVILSLPPLRERGNDIVRLMEHFLGQLNSTRPGNEKSLSSSARTQLERHPWPGNIRELQTLIHRGFVLSGVDREIRPEHLFHQAPPAAGVGGKRPSTTVRVRRR